MFGEPLSSEAILQRVSPWKIFEKYVGGKGLSSSPFRTDNHPSFSVYENQDGKPRFKDFATGQQGDCFTLVMLKYKCTFQEALQIIDIDFGLGFSSGEIIPSSVLFGQEPVIRKTEIKIRPKNWDWKDRKFWGKYALDLEFVKSYDVIPVSAARLVRTRGDVIKINDINYFFPSYAFRLGPGIFKIYSPYHLSLKWVSNCTKNHLLGFDQLPWTGELLVITKSLKDVMVLGSLGVAGVATQGESSVPSKEILYALNKRFEKVVVLYDQDEAGHRGSAGLSHMFDYSSVFIPADERIKDISDYIKLKGVKKTWNLLKDLKLVRDNGKQ